MYIFKKIADLQTFLVKTKNNKISVGFVPTMGALHDGHLSLIRQSQLESDITVCSIFVNPTQFNETSDFEKYPSTLPNDIKLLTEQGCDVVFAPSVDEIYPNGSAQNVPSVDIGLLGNVLEGEHRPGHFNGVLQVMHRLLSIISPNNLYMGQKDYQQVLVCAELIKQSKFKTRLVMCAIARETDGLAMSSRNLRLSVDERKHAVVLNQTLQAIAQDLKEVELPILLTEYRQFLNQHPVVELEYLEAADADTLQPITTDRKKGIVLCIAAFVGPVRLIDNWLIE